MFRHVRVPNYALTKIEPYRKVFPVFGFEVTELYEEDGCTVFQVYGPDDIPSVEFYILEDKLEKRGRIVVTSKETMEHFNDAMNVMLTCSGCNEGFYGGYYVSNGKVLCMSCHADYVNGMKYLMDIDVGIDVRFGNVSWDNMSRPIVDDVHRFLSYVLYYMKNHAVNGGYAHTSLDHIVRFWRDGREYPQSNEYDDFLKWVSDNNRYSCWVLRFFLEHDGRVPFYSPLFLKYVVKACEAYVGGYGGIDLENTNATIPARFYKRTWFTEEVVPLFTRGTWGDRATFYFLTRDNVLLESETKVSRKWFDGTDIVWGEPVKLRFKVDVIEDDPYPGGLWRRPYVRVANVTRKS